MKTSLFSEFSEASASAWRQIIEKDLKGEPFDTLVWKNPNGFDVQPFFTKEDLNSPYSPAFTHASWTMSCKPLVTDAPELNKRLLHLLQKGASGIVVENVPGELEAGLRDIQLDLISSAFCLPAQRLEELRKLLAKHYPSQSLDLRLIATDVTTDQDIAKWVDAASAFSPWGTSAIGVDAATWSNAGALEYYEIAISFSKLIQWFEHASPGLFERRGITIRTSVNTDLFTQIAKLRAYRRLWEIFRKELGLKADLHIIAETSLTANAISDEYNNMIRCTIECFAAITGGCNALVAHPHNALTGPDAESERLALNQQLILREECFLSRMADVSCGSYYIERLTDQLAEKALQTFKIIQKEGGYLALLENGKIVQTISEHSSKMTERVKREEQIIVGVNKFRAADPTADISKVITHLHQSGIFNPAVTFESNRTQKA